MDDKKERMTEDKQFGIDSLTPPESVDYFIYRLETGRWKRAATCWMIAAFVVFIALVLTNVGWIYYESQFEDVTITAEQTADNQSNNYAIGGDFLGSDTEGNNQEAPS